MLVSRGDTHNKKLYSQPCFKKIIKFTKVSIMRGRHPLKKTVAVVDEYDNVYEATYPSRAKGLVKKGRARFIGENKICLACPPILRLEDTKMSENITDKVSDELLTAELKPNAAVESAAVTNAPSQTADDTPAAQPGSNTETVCTEKVEYNIEYVLAQISALSEQSKSNKDIIARINDKETDTAKAQALATAVSAREETTRRLIDLYEKMYSDLRPKDFSVMYKAMDLIERTVNNPNCTAEQKASITDMLTAVGKLEF